MNRALVDIAQPGLLQPHRTIHILLDEDDVPTHEWLCTALARPPDFSVSSAGTLAEAMDGLGQAPDVLLTD